MSEGGQDLSTSPQQLIEAARQARLRAYCPYSEFAVGAAVETDSPACIYTGCNIENAAYSETVCAERVAVYKAISEGAKDIRALAVVAAGVRPPRPCGACLQVLAELAPECRLYLATPDGEFESCHLADLLPQPFSSRQANRRMVP